MNDPNESFLVKNGNLDPQFIIRYGNYNNKKPLIVTWNGNTDMEILKSIGIAMPVFNVTCYDTYNNGNFYLQLINTENNKIITQLKLGYINKKGRLTNLEEMHKIICEMSHNDTYIHNPVTDVNLTKCIFNHLIINTNTSLESLISH